MLFKVPLNEVAESSLYPIFAANNKLQIKKLNGKTWLLLQNSPFNPFQENTYLIYDETREAVIIDPGCSNRMENEELLGFIRDNNLQPKHLILTHAHIDHVMGVSAMREAFDLPLTGHPGEQAVLDAVAEYGSGMGLRVEDPGKIDIEIREGDAINFGDTKLIVLDTPGHSPASVSFLIEGENKLIAGDVLFQGSIGRVDLPGGDYHTLMTSIEEKFMVLDDSVIVHAGHGPDTTIGNERRSNLFWLEWLTERKV